ncbi:aspartate aminotransferase [Candidatus Epulonipiscium fishelsonii]|uniref:Aspartate aminotransferase n=1 Tax=Candidatus Epulonipiscium fishelsonii TaxID=77094 RepID=A0ACC8XAM7_9FIRM|nr:aspartate aminotransferase [Epulopiscium sp. SCG-B05WGA-EpuloA1]ONI39450.1 aspartate aminotransferase [Epulopiscium sp. SCG-B11WGA-EpuloA1]
MFSNDNINIEILRKKAFNYRWAEVEEGVIPLTAADPDFPVAKEITATIKNYIEDGYFSYVPKEGLKEFREAIANALNSRKNEAVEANLVLPIDSAARGMYIIAETVLEEGDEVIIFDPVDYLFKQSTLRYKGVPVLFPSKLNEEGRIDLSNLREYVTDKTKMICLCNPHNPLGSLYSKEDLELILDIANENDLYIMNDEIWSDIVYSDGEFISILSLGNERNKKTLSVFGFSKSFGVAGLRVGCIYATDEELFNKIIEKSDVLTTAGGVSSLSQIAGMACVNDSYYWVEEFIKHLEKNRDYAVSRLNNMKGVTCHKPHATYLVFPNIAGTGYTSSEIAECLMKDAKLAIVPGTEKFFGEGANGHIRICLATSMEVLKEGLDRMEHWLNTNVM